MLRRRTYLRSVSALAASAAVAGCTGSGDGTDEPDGDGAAAATQPVETDPSNATPGQTATSGNGDSGTTAGGNTARSEYPDYNWGQLDGAGATAVTTVDITEFAFDPLVARVPAGEAIAFPNTDSAAHTVTAPALGVDRVIEGGNETTLTFDRPGTYDYVCRFHPPDMLGRLVVAEGGTVDGTATGGTVGTETSGGGAGGGGGGAGPY